MVVPPALTNCLDVCNRKHRRPGGTVGVSLILKIYETYDKKRQPIPLDRVLSQFHDVGFMVDSSQYEKVRANYDPHYEKGERPPPAKKHRA